MASKVVKALWLVLALVGSAGLVLWMSEHGDLGAKTGGSKMSGIEAKAAD